MRNLYKRFRIEAISTTDEVNGTLEHHKKIRESWDGRVIPCFRPDSVTGMYYLFQFRLSPLYNCIVQVY
ncbi:MAG: glucuronate isomerase [Promethearchaeota archaeon]